jgi:hypothetical protein
MPVWRAKLGTAWAGAQLIESVTVAATTAPPYERYRISMWFFEFDKQCATGAMDTKDPRSRA